MRNVAAPAVLSQRPVIAADDPRHSGFVDPVFGCQGCHSQAAPLELNTPFGSPSRSNGQHIFGCQLRQDMSRPVGAITAAFVERIDDVLLLSAKPKVTELGAKDTVNLVPSWDVVSDAGRVIPPGTIVTNAHSFGDWFTARQFVSNTVSVDMHHRSVHIGTDVHVPVAVGKLRSGPAPAAGSLFDQSPESFCDRFGLRAGTAKARGRDKIGVHAESPVQCASPGGVCSTARAFACSNYTTVVAR